MSKDTNPTALALMLIISDVWHYHHKFIPSAVKSSSWRQSRCQRVASSNRARSFFSMESTSKRELSVDLRIFGSYFCWIQRTSLA
jgi:hypothetical protein